MATEAQQAASVKHVADELQLTFEALRRAATNISGLLQLGRATCEEVRAYNAWAMAIFESQRGMLATLRAAGQPGLPAQPAPPTLFPIKGRSGVDAILIDCGDGTSLAGLMKAAMKKSTRYLSSSEIGISTSDPFVFNPAEAPSYKALTELQAQRKGEGLGLAPIVILIAAIAITIVVSSALVALFKYLETNSIQESNSEQVRQQSEAFAKYTEARLACLAQCTQGGKSTEDCVDVCADLVDKPEFKLPGEFGKWGTLQWVGFTVLLAGGLYIGWKIYERKQHGKPLFELPESVQDAIS